MKPFRWSANKNTLLQQERGISFEAITVAVESGALLHTLKAVADKDELQRMRAAACATAIKDKRVNIRLSSADLQDLQARALAEGMPYQTLIASILHKYVAGKLAEQPQAGSPAQRRTTSRSTRAV